MGKISSLMNGEHKNFCWKTWAVERNGAQKVRKRAVCMRAENKMYETGFKQGSRVIVNVLEEGFVIGTESHTVVRGVEEKRIQKAELEDQRRH